MSEETFKAVFTLTDEEGITHPLVFFVNGKLRIHADVAEQIASAVADRFALTSVEYNEDIGGSEV